MSTIGQVLDVFLLVNRQHDDVTAQEEFWVEFHLRFRRLRHAIGEPCGVSAIEALGLPPETVLTTPAEQQLVELKRWLAIQGITLSESVHTP